MNYDRIILELMSRVQVLEEQVSEMKAELASRKIESEGELDGADSEHEEFTRSQARDVAIKIIQDRFPDYLVDKASRREGSGIKILGSDINSKRAVIIKFFHSKTYEHPTGKFEHAWHTVNLDEIIGSIFDYCLFSVADKNGNWNFFLYEPDELGMYREENRSSTSGEILHLYFVVKGGKATEVRERIIDVTDHLNNWDVLE